MNRYCLIVILFIQSAACFSQQNCSTPLQVMVCPAVYLASQTNDSLVDDAPPLCNIPGEDVVYELHTSGTTHEIYLSILNLSNVAILSVLNDSCTANPVFRLLGPGNNFHKIPVSPGGIYYITIDSYVTVNYDISFGADTNLINVNIPDTRGNLMLDTSHCAAPPFQPSKPFYQVLYNNVYQTNPMTLSPLFIPGNMCINAFFKNKTGDEGIKYFDFTFNTTGYSNISAPDSIPGFYNSGFWIVSNPSPGQYNYTFHDSAATGRGDFTGNPDTCLLYAFCFTLTPLSNDTALTNVNCLITSDNYGAPVNIYQRYGCCPYLFPTCLNNPGGNGGGGGGAGSTFGFGFNDPGNGSGSLPVELILFRASAVEDDVQVTWTTASESNNDFFTLMRSADGRNWHEAVRIKGAGNKATPSDYIYTDKEMEPGTWYYQLKQTDYDGFSTWSEIISAEINYNNTISIYPVPAKHFLIIQTESNATYTLNSMCCGVQMTGDLEAGSSAISVESLKPGVYTITITDKSNVSLIKKIIKI